MRMYRKAVVALGLAAALGWSGLGPVRAAMAPDNVAAEVAEAAKACRDSGGKPNTEAMLRVDDLNGDGGEDWIVDYAKLDCAGAINPFCGSSGCSLSIYFWSGGSTWRKAFDDLVRSYRFRTVRGARVLEVHYGGAACGRVNAEDCRKMFRVQRTGIVPMR
jgi:hypothetical protein